MAKAAVVRLPPLAEAQREKLKNEMLGEFLGSSLFPVSMVLTSVSSFFVLLFVLFFRYVQLFFLSSLL